MSNSNNSENFTTSEKIRNYYGIVLDESGSMFSTKNDTLGSLYTFHNEQKDDFHPASPFVVHTFSSNVRLKYDKFLCDDITKLEYKPNGTTALYDAIKESILHAEKEISRMSKNQKILS